VATAAAILRTIADDLGLTDTVVDQPVITWTGLVNYLRVDGGVVAQARFIVAPKRHLT